MEAGFASPQEKVSFVAGVGEMELRKWVSLIYKLLLDEDPEVRKYSLQTIVIDLDVCSKEMLEFCQERLLQDEEPAVRSMAASCLGKIGWQKKDPQLFRFLKARLDDESESNWVRGSAYDALMRVMGVRDGWWRSQDGFRATFDPQKHIDQARLAGMEAELERPAKDETP